MTDFIERNIVDAKRVSLEDTFNIEQSEDNSLLLDYIKENYSYIYQAMKVEEYRVEEFLCEYLCEIVYDGKVVGFYTIEFISDFLKEQLCINEFYVMPEYRGNGIFINTLKSLIGSGEYDEVLLRNPPRLVINILLENGLATRFSKNLVRTGIKLATRMNKIIRNKKINNLFDLFDEDMASLTYLGNIYDMNLNSIVFNDTMEIISSYDEIVFFSNPRRCDYNRYHLAKRVRNLDKRYVRNTYKNVIRSWDELEKFQEDVDSQFLEDEGIDMYLGTLDKPNSYIRQLIKDDILTVEDYEIIRSKIEEALFCNEISPDNIKTRFYYLVDYPDKEALVTGSARAGHCPYCDGIEIIMGVCEKCGYNLFDKKIESIQKEIKDSVDPSTGVYKSLLKTIEEKSLDKDRVISDQIEISACQLLNFINQIRNYPSLPNFDDNNMISEELYVKYLVDNGYIELKENTDKNDEKNFLESLKESGGIPSTRTYKAHMHRDYKYKITKKGRRYYAQNKIADLYIDKVLNLPYYAFKQFYKENINSSSKNEILNGYLEIMERQAIEEEDLTSYNYACLTRINTLRDSDDDELLYITLIKSLICRLNYYLLSKDEENFTQTPIDSYNEVAIMLSEDLIDEYDYKDAYDKAFDSIELDKLKINRDKLYEDVEDVLYADDIDEINRQLMIKYNDIR